MALLKTWYGFTAADWKMNSAAGATVKTDALGRYINFLTTTSRCESRLLVNGNERWWPQGTLRVMTWTDRYFGLSQGKFLVTVQMKALPDDTHPAGAPVTPTRSYDGEASRWNGDQKLCIRNNAEDSDVPYQTIMTRAQLVEHEGKWLDRMHAEVTGPNGNCYVISAWKPHGATEWSRYIRVDGPNVRVKSGIDYSGPLTFTLGVYGGDTNLRQHDILLNSPRLYDNLAEAEAAIGIDAVVDPPPPPPPSDGPTQAEYDALLAERNSLVQRLTASNVELAMKTSEAAALSTKIALAKEALA